MFIVHVFIHVKAEYVDAFSQASIENARNSVLEQGIARFDVLRDRDDPNRFVLVEVYRSEEAVALHKETSHYKKWREVVEPMMAELRRSIKFTNIFPDENGWS